MKKFNNGSGIVIEARLRLGLPQVNCVNAPTATCCGCCAKITKSLYHAMACRGPKTVGLVSQTRHAIIKKAIAKCIQEATGVRTLEESDIALGPDQECRPDLAIPGWTFSSPHFDVVIVSATCGSHIPRVTKPQGQRPPRGDAHIRYAEDQKRKKYGKSGQRVTPLAFGALGGFGKQASQFFKNLASTLAHPRSSEYHFWLRVWRRRIAFTLARCRIQAIAERRRFLMPPPEYPD